MSMRENRRPYHRNSLLQQLSQTLSLGRKLSKWIFLAREGGIQVQLFQPFLTQSVWYQNGVANQAVDPPFLS